MNKRFQWLATHTLALGMAMSLLVGVNNVPVYAQAVDGTLNDLGEGESRVLTSGWQTLNPGEQITYQFAYNGEEQPVSVWMNAIPEDGAIFQIWTDERLEELGEDPETEPLGQGTTMDENTGFTNWLGGSPEAETYYVVVSATGNSTARFLLNISSPALAPEQPGATAQQTDNGTGTTPADPDIAVVTTDALNVRSGPSTAFPVIVTIPNGTQMTVLGRNAINTWINVRLEDGTEGWVTRSLTSYTLTSPNVIAPGASTAASVGASVTATATTTTTATGTTTSTGTSTGTTTDTVTTGAADITGTAAVSPTMPVTATELGAGWQVLNPSEVAWYTFQYRGGGLPLTVWMDVEPSAGAEFVVMNQESAAAAMDGATPAADDVIGRGRTNPVEPGYLFWQADFEEADVFYVMVTPADDAEEDVLYSIYALGPGVGRLIEAEDAE